VVRGLVVASSFSPCRRDTDFRAGGELGWVVRQRAADRKSGRAAPADGETQALREKHNVRGWMLRSAS